MEDSQIISDARLLTRSLGQLPDPLAKPVLIVVSGLPGTGKSYFCKKLSEKISFLILESDALRKVLFSSPTYTILENSRLFQAIHHLIEELLTKGIPLIFDATNLSEWNREYLYNIADRLNVRLILVRIEAPPQLVHARLNVRAKGKEPEEKSDADWTVYQGMKHSIQKIRRHHYAVDTSRDITPVLDKIVREASR